MLIFKFILLFCVSPSKYLHALNVQYCRKLDFQSFFIAKYKNAQYMEKCTQPIFGKLAK